MGFRGNHKNRRDGNEKDIFSIIRNYGIQVEPMDIPCDAVCGYMGNNYLVEIKNRSEERRVGKECCSVC
jgi:hypothetical protein